MGWAGKGWLGGERLGGYPPELAWWTGGQGGGARAPGNCKGFGSGGVGGRDTGPRDGANFATYVVFLSFLHIQKEEKWRFLKDALWGGGGVPTGAGLVDGGVDQGPWLQERVRSDGSSKEGGGLGLGWLFQRGASPGKGSGKGWLGGRRGCKGFGCGGKW